MFFLLHYVFQVAPLIRIGIFTETPVCQTRVNHSPLLILIFIKVDYRAKDKRHFLWFNQVKFF